MEKSISSFVNNWKWKGLLFQNDESQRFSCKIFKVNLLGEKLNFYSLKIKTDSQVPQ